MADPVTLTAISIGATAAGGGISALSSIFGGEAQSKAYQYQAGVANMNALIAKQNAAYATASGEVEAQESGMKTQAEIGQTKAQQGAGGLDVNSGSNKAVQTSELEIGQQNQALIRSNAARAAYGYEVQAANATAQGQLFSMSAATSKTAGFLSGIGTLLGTAGSVSGKWLQAGQQGIFGGSGGNPTGYSQNPWSDQGIFGGAYSS